jgi:hypothetical protein
MVLRRSLPLLIAVAIAFTVFRLGRLVDSSGGLDTVSSLLAFAVVMLFALALEPSLRRPRSRSGRR